MCGPANLAGHRYELLYEYDDEVKTHVTRITDSFGYESTADYNFKYGRVEKTRDLNGNEMENSYDKYGRLEWVKGPFEAGTNNKTIEFFYTPDASVPYAVTKHFDPYRDASDPIETVLFTDGLKRVIQTKRKRN